MAACVEPTMSVNIIVASTRFCVAVPVVAAVAVCPLARDLPDEGLDDIEDLIRIDTGEVIGSSELDEPGTGDV